VSYPTADQIARAIVTACGLTGDKPIATCMRQPSRARNVALQALIELFPDANRRVLGRCLGYAKPATATTTLGMARKSTWWRDEWVDEVVGAVLGGEGDEP
jgi:hypothetical protein